MIINRLRTKWRENNRCTTAVNQLRQGIKLTTDKKYVISLAQQVPHKGPLDNHTRPNPNKMPKKGH